MMMMLYCQAERLRTYFCFNPRSLTFFKMEFLFCRCREKATLAEIEQTVKLWFAMLVIVDEHDSE